MARAWDITSDDLDLWAQEHDAPSILPKLIRRLLLATAPLHSIDMRAAGGVRLGGWDGVVIALVPTEHCPRGISLWELSTQKAKSKLDDDYRKRTENPGAGVVRERTTYVAVTARRYPGKQEWMRAKRDQGEWADVRLYDADDLATWLERAPAVAAWFAADELNRPVDGITDVETYLHRWSARTMPPLPHDVVRAGRRREQRQLRMWLERLPTERRSMSLFVRGDTREEAVLFVASTLASLAVPEASARDALLARTMVIEHREAWRWAARAGSSMPLLLVPDFEELDSGEARAYEGPCVIPLDRGDAVVGDQELRLSPLDPGPLAHALVEAGFAEPEARARAQASGGKLNALQRLHGYERPPRWAQEPGLRAPFMAMLLAGRWASGSEADRQAVSDLGCDADTVAELCTRLASRGDAPVEQVDGVWQWCAPADAWNALARELTKPQLERFCKVAIRVLSEDEPRYDMPARERMVALVHGKVLAHSSDLRQGLAESLVYLARHDDALQGTHGRSIGSPLAARVVEEILAPAWQRWASLSELLPILAAAAPQAFLDALQRSLDLGDEGAGHLPAEEVDAFSGHSPHVGLLWALEMLGRIPAHVSLVGDLLAELAACDPGGSLANRPAASLLDLLHPWAPRSATDVRGRLRILERIMKRWPEVGRRLALDMLDMEGGVRRDSNEPGHLAVVMMPSADVRHLRDEDVRVQITGVLDLLVRDADEDASRWSELLEAASALGQEWLERVLDALDGRGHIADPEAQLWATLRTQIYQLHRRHRDTEAPPLVMRMQSLYRAFEPDDPVLRIAWLFGGLVLLPERARVDFQEQQARMDAHREQALEAQLAAAEPWRFLQRLCETNGVVPGILGQTLARTSMAGEVEAHLLESLDQAFDQALERAAYEHVLPAFLARRFQDRDEAWLEGILRRLIDRGHVDVAARAAADIPVDAHSWDLVDRLGEPLRSAYWRAVRFVPPQPTTAAWTRAIENLLQASNYAAAVQAAFRGFAERPHPVTREHAELIIEVLEGARDALEQDTPEPAIHRGDEIALLFETVYESGPTAMARVARLEGYFLELLRRHSVEPRHLFAELADNPASFVVLLRVLYRREDEDASDISDDEDEVEMRQRRAQGASRILDAWEGYPGEGLEPEERETRLLAWARAALEQASEQGRGEAGAAEIARVLARAPGAPEDGMWPCRAARELLEDRAHPELAHCLLSAERHRRGIFSTSLAGMGAQERARAATFREHADAVRPDWPRTAAMLDRLAQRYESDAERFDEKARAMGLGPREPGERADGTGQEDHPAAGEVAQTQEAAGPEAPPAEIQRLDRVKIEHVGPAPVIDLELAPRLNLITGDNSAGKTFVLDVLWWVLTGSWAVHEAWPKKKAEHVPSIWIGADAPIRSTFDFVHERWSMPAQWPLMRGLVMYARVDGGFSVWDPMRSAGHGTPHGAGVHFTPDEVLYGKDLANGSRGVRVCEGLIADWTDWEARKRDVFARFARVFRGLSPHGEPMELGPAERIRVDDAREYPHIRLPYDNVPIIHASAALKRILSLAYLLVWAWHEHRENARMLAEAPATGMVLLIDEVEAHLHPAWQRVLLPALFEVIGPRGEEDAGQGFEDLDVQCLATTHAPLVTASVEPIFEPERDALFHFDLDAQGVTARRLPWHRRGDVSAWLTSEVFDLEQPRSLPAENAIRQALALYREPTPDKEEILRVDQALRRVLSEMDPFWVRWSHFVQSHEAGQ